MDKKIEEILKSRDYLHACWRYIDQDFNVIKEYVFMNRNTGEVVEYKEKIEFLPKDMLSEVHVYRAEYRGKKKHKICYVVNISTSVHDVVIPGVAFSIVDYGNRPVLLKIEQPYKEQNNFYINIIKGEEYLNRDLLYIPYHEFWDFYFTYDLYKYIGRNSRIQVRDYKVAWLLPAKMLTYYNRYLHVYITTVQHPIVPIENFMAGYVLELFVYNSPESVEKRKHFLGVNYKPVLSIPMERKHKEQIIEKMKKYIKEVSHE